MPRTPLSSGSPALILLALLGCAPGGDLPADPATQGDARRFVDLAARAGIDFVTRGGGEDKQHLPETLGSGVAIADFDGDGDLDLYVGTAQPRDAWLAESPRDANALYRNNGDGTFTDVAEQAGVALRAWTTGTYFADVDNDGDKDLFVTCWGRNMLYLNDGDGTFTDVSRTSGIGAYDRWSAGAAFGDLDNDGDLDLYVANYCHYDMRKHDSESGRIIWMGIEVFVGPQGLPGEPDVLYRNHGNGVFSDVTREAGIEDYTRPLYGLGVVMSDLDLDGDLDLYVANDSVANYLWRNDGDLRFTEIAFEAGVATNESARDQAGMGTDAGDYDGDGLVDLFVTNFSHDFNTLYRNDGELYFTDATFEARFKDSYSRLVWGTKFFDYDNDGWLDIFVANGHIYPAVDDNPQLNTRYAQPNALYRNLGDGTFDNRSDTTGPGLAIVESSRGVAVADLEPDGDLDLVVTNLEAPPNVLINDGSDEGSWIGLRLVGTLSNRDAIGARVEVEAGDRILVREVNPFGSYLSQSGYPLHFGLGSTDRIDRVTIHWPSGAVETLTELAPRRHVTLVEGRGVADDRSPAESWRP